MSYPPWYMALNAGECQKAILQIVSLSQSSWILCKTFDHHFHAVVIEKKTYNVFLLSKLKVKMVSILCFRKWFQWYWRVCQVIKLVSNLYQGVFLQINFNFLCRIAKAIFLMSVVYKIASLFTQLNYCLERCNITVKEVSGPTVVLSYSFVLDTQINVRRL